MSRMFLSRGAHKTVADGACAMEWVAWVAGEPHSDHPACVSLVIGTFMRNWNDEMDDADRQQLIPLLLDCIGTRTGAADDITRGWLALDWLVREHTPAWLAAAGLHEQAAALRALTPIRSHETLSTCQGRIVAARDAAGAAARDAARAAAGAAVWAAFRASAWNAAWNAARNAAQNAAWNGAGNAAWDASAMCTPHTIRATVVALQQSAADLVRRMCAVGRQPIVCDDERVRVIAEEAHAAL